MNKLLMLKGLPGSGKSFFANQFVLDNPEYIIISKEKIQEDLGILIYNSEVSRILLIEQIKLTKNVIKQGKSVILDDANLNPYLEKLWKKFCHILGIEFLLHTMDTPVDVCIYRDSKRKKSLGKHVILNLHKNYVITSNTCI